MYPKSEGEAFAAPGPHIAFGPNRPSQYIPHHHPVLPVVHPSPGVPNAIVKLANEDLRATLAVSIHAPNQTLRETIIPSAKAYPIQELMKVRVSQGLPHPGADQGERAKLEDEGEEE